MSARGGQLRLVGLGALAVALVVWLVLGSNPQRTDVTAPPTPDRHAQSALLPGTAPTLAGAPGVQTDAPEEQAPSPWGVTGRVQYPGRRPAVDVEVVLYAERDDRKPAASTRTDATGAYRLPMPAGERSGLHVVRVRARDGKGHVAQYDAYNIKVPRTEDQAIRTLLLRPSQALSLRVLADGQPVSDALVELFHHGTVRHGLVAEARTDPSGDVRFEDLEALAYLPWVHAPGRLPVQSQIALPWTEDSPYVIDIGRPRTLTVRVVRADSGAPVPGVEVALLRQLRLANMSFSRPIVSAPDAPRTDDEGEVRFEGLDRGADVALGIGAPGFATARWSSDARGWLASHTSPVPVPPHEDLVTVRLPVGRTVAWPLVAGDGPLPDDGTIVRLDGGEAGQRPYGLDEGRIVDGRLVVEGLTQDAFTARAVAPDGRVARVYVGRTATEGEAVAFWKPRQLVVRLREQGSAPSKPHAVRLDVPSGPQLTTPFARTDAEGVARWETLPALVGTLSVQGSRLAPTDVDLRTGDVDVTLDLPVAETPLRPSHKARLHVRIEGSPQLPDGIQLEPAEWDSSWIRVEAEHESEGILDVTWCGTSEAASGEFTLRGEGLQCAHIKLSPSDGEKTVDLLRGCRLSVVVLGSYDIGSIPRLQQSDSPEGPWQSIEDLGRRRSGENVLPLASGAPGWEMRLDGLAPGWYRMIATISPTSERTSDPVQVRDDAAPRTVLDLRPAGAVSGLVTVPRGHDVAQARVAIQGTRAHKLVRVGADGSFTLPWPDGATSIELVAYHPRLVPDARTGRVKLSTPPEGVRLELVEGAVAEVELVPGNAKLRARATPGVLLFDPARPDVAPRELPGHLEGVEGGRFVLRFAGYEAGRWTVWCDAFGGAAPVRIESAALDEMGALLGPVDVRAGSRVVLRVPGADGKPTPMLVLAAEFQGQPAHRRDMAVANKDEITLVGLEAGRWHVTGGPLDIAKDEVIRVLDEVIEVDGVSAYERAPGAR